MVKKSLLHVSLQVLHKDGIYKLLATRKYEYWFLESNYFSYIQTHQLKKTAYCKTNKLVINK